MTSGERTAFDPDGSLRDLRIDDLFHPMREGAEQACRDAEQVYLDGSGILVARPAEPVDLRIGELGFGTGLNFLLCWKRFRERAPEGSTLIYSGIEGYPLSRERIEQALAPFGELAGLREELQRSWPDRPEGVQTIPLDAGRVRLVLLFGDAQQILADHSFRCAHWILDGFSPAKNPEMWSATLMQSVAAHSESEAGCGTYTIARAVRDHLTEAGFEIERKPGAGFKRDRLEGRLGHTPPPAPDWNTRPTHAAPRRVRVIGSGLAGCATAHALTRRGIEVELVDPHGLAGGASGQRLAVFQPRLGGHDNPDARFVATAFNWTRSLLERLDPAQTFWSPCGVAHPARDEAARAQTLRRLEQAGLPESTARWIDADELGGLAGRRIEALGALYLPTAGMLSPRRFCERLLDDAGLEAPHAVSTGAPCDLQILANAHHAAEPGREWLGLRPTRGQTTLIHALDEPSPIVLCDGGYVTPTYEGLHALGATYGHGDGSDELRDEDDAANVERSRTRFPELGIEADAFAVARESGVRATTVDRFPIVGRIPDTGAFDRGEAPRWTNLAIQAGHGSRGSVTAPFCGEILAAELTGEALPVTYDLARRLAPLRALVRDRRNTPDRPSL